MFEFTKKFDVNEKLAFSFFSGPGDEAYTLLVKKVKDNLVAAVISNNDKNRVDLNVNDEIYLFSEADGVKWVTKTLLMQRNSYPLVILSVAEEPLELAPDIKSQTPAPDGEIESAGQAQVPGVDESEAVDDLTSVPGITIRELKAEPERAGGQEGMRFGAEDLDDLPDIDTSELEAELSADIEDTLEKGRVRFTTSHDIEDEMAAPEPLAEGISGEPQEEDDLSDMTIEKDASLELGILDEEEPAAPTVEKREEPEPLEVGEDEPEEEPEAGDKEYLYVPEDEDETPAETGAFHDFFTAYLTPIGSGGTAEPAGLDVDVPPEVKRAIGALTERIERLEGALSTISGRPAAERVTAPARISVVLAGLTEEGFKAAMEEAPMGGEKFTVEIDRPWKPPLFLKAAAVAESSFSVNDITLARFSFEGLDDAGRTAVRNYLDGRAGYFKSLTDMVKD